jgi:precorrin-6A/cobalt-precorrin-6A reductase
MPPERILVLGGTTEAREAADVLQSLGHDVIFSLAGVTVEPLLPSTPLRSGGFGGVAGLVGYMRAENISAVLDATHPFAAIMSRQAHEACTQTGVKLARLERSAWREQPGDNWQHVDSIAEAAQVLPDKARVMLTTGRKEIVPFTQRPSLGGIVRTIEPPEEPLPSAWQLLQIRPPFSFETEKDLMVQYAITHLVSKNAGSASTIAKLEAARALKIQVVMVARPEKPQCLHFPDVNSLLQQQSRWLGRNPAWP